MSLLARGSFNVRLGPLPTYDTTEASTLGRMSIDKEFQGDLTATSLGEMLSARTAIADSAGYVAIERVSGTLHGRSGSFILQHSSTMARGEPHQMIAVVPDSGTDQLTGLAGTMLIIIADGQHTYQFTYTLPDIAA